MERLNRCYKRKEPFRDPTLFVIACEGAVREREYFEAVAILSSRIRIKLLNRDQLTHSAAQWIIDTAAAYKDEVGFANDDQLWIVIDVDAWNEDLLREIAFTCRETRNWNLALSNPCFDVWLFMHIDDIANAKATSCKELKDELQVKIKDGHSKMAFVAKIKEAHDRAMILDPMPQEYFMPGVMRSKLHLLVKELFKIVGTISPV